MITIANWIADLFMLGISIILICIGVCMAILVIGVIVKEIKDRM